MARPPALGTIVPSVRYQVINRDTMKWETVLIGPETPRSHAEAFAGAGGRMLWVHDGDGPRRPAK